MPISSSASSTENSCPLWGRKVEVVLRDREAGLLDKGFLADPPSEVGPALRKGLVIEPARLVSKCCDITRLSDKQESNGTYHILLFASTKLAAVFLRYRYSDQQCPG